MLFVLTFVLVCSFTYCCSLTKRHSNTILPILILLMQHVPGDVLELGANVQTSPYLHYIHGYKRRYYTIDTCKQSITDCKKKCYYQDHKFIHIETRKNKIFKNVDPWKKLKVKSFFGICVMNHKIRSRELKRLRRKACIFVFPNLYPSFMNKFMYGNDIFQFVSSFPFIYHSKTLYPSCIVTSDYIDINAILSMNDI